MESCWPSMSMNKEKRRRFDSANDSRHCAYAVGGRGSEGGLVLMLKLGGAWTTCWPGRGSALRRSTQVQFPQEPHLQSYHLQSETCICRPSTLLDPLLSDENNQVEGKPRAANIPESRLHASGSILVCHHNLSSFAFVIGL